MKNRICLSVLLALFGLSSCSDTQGQSIDLYVSPQGHDYLDGRSPDHPMKCIHRALREAREIRRIGKEDVSQGIRIHLADGTYCQEEPLFFRPEDSGTEGAPTTIIADHPGKAIISGGREVTGWQPLTESVEGLPEAARGKVWVADAPRVGNRILESRQLWVNGKKAERAALVPHGEMIRMTDFRKEKREIWIPTPEVSGLEKAQQAEMVVHQRWAIAILRIKEMETVGKVTRVSFHEPESRLEFEHPWPQPVIGEEKGNSSFNIVGDIRLLDRPGEWWQEYPSGKIYYYPRPDEQMEEAVAVMPYLPTLIRIAGSDEREVAHIRMEGVSLQHAAWLRPSLSGHVTLQGGMPLLDAYKLAIPGLPEKAELENQAWIGRPVSAVQVEGAHHISFEGCEFMHLGATALDLEQAVRDSRVSGSLFTDIGGTAIAIGTFPDQGFETHVPYIPKNPKELCSNILISDNLITEVANEDWGCVGIGAGYVRDVVIEHNEVSHLNYSGICVGWGWTALESGMRNNHIRNNYVHHFAGQLYDAGGIYTLSNQPGSSITGNRIEHLIDAPYATNDRAFYIYLDEATDGFTISDNWCPEIRFGDNKPGPALIWGTNGPTVAPEIKNAAGRRSK